MSLFNNYYVPKIPVTTFNEMLQMRAHGLHRKYKK